MRIAIVVKGGLHPSGREQVMPGWVVLLERLARRHEVHAFVTRHLPAPSSYSLRGFTVHDLGSPAAAGRFGRWPEWRALRAALRASGRFDVVHGFWADPGWLAAAAARAGRVPSVVTFNSGEFSAIEDFEYGLQRTARGRTLVNLAIALATEIHVTTRYMERLANEHGCRPRRIPIGVDVGALRPPARRPTGPPWRLLNVASLNAVKDHRTLLDAVAIVVRTHNVHLDLIGADTFRGGLQRHAAHIGIANYVTFHGFLPFDELLPFYQRAHLYVQSSRHEAAGAAVLEAAACGLATVGTRVGYVADWADDASVAVDPGNSAALATAIVELLRDDQRRLRLGGRARTFAESHDVDWTAQELDGLYTAVVHGKDSEQTHR